VISWKTALAQVAPGRISEIARNLHERLDTWQNDLTGFGTSRDKTAYTAFAGVQYLTDPQVANLYHGDPIAARMVDIVPDECFREGFTVDVGDESANAELAEQLEQLGVREHFANGQRWGRAFGAGALLIGADDGRPASAPLIPERAKGVRYLYELDKRLLYPLSWYREPGHPKLGQPETYIVSSANGHVDSGAYSVVHESRLIVFTGATTGLWEKANNNGFDRSVLQRAYEALRAFNTGMKAVEVLMTDGNQAVYKLQGLAGLIASNGEEAIRTRMQVMDMFRSVLRGIVLDAGDPDTKAGAEDFMRQTVSLAEYPQTLDRFMLQVCLAVQVPATILFGQSPAGMNATGESDFRWFYDRIRSTQQLYLTPRVRRLVRVMMAMKSIKRDSGIKITWPSLWKDPPAVEATRKKTIAETDAIRIGTGELLPEEVALTRSQPNGWDIDVTIRPEGIEARSKGLAANEADLAEGTPEPEPPGGGFGGGFGGGDADGGNFDAGDYERDDNGQFASTGGEDPMRLDADELLTAIEASTRSIIAGGPRTGKSTLAVRASERFKRTVRHADSLVGKLNWSDSSAEVSRWLDDGDEYVIEGVTAPRALRKWLAANPDKKLDATVVYLRDPLHAQTDGQRSMSKAIDSVWSQIKPELLKRGASIIERDS